VEIAAKIDEGVIRKIQVRGRGCSISVASGSMMAELLEGKTLADARKLLEAFKGLMKGEEAADGVDLGDLEALEGVQRFPVRIKCALLPWTTLEETLKSE
jgi:nitrogen fixation NifU-like protein